MLRFAVSFLKHIKQTFSNTTDTMSEIRPPVYPTYWANPTYDMTKARFNDENEVLDCVIRLDPDTGHFIAIHPKTGQQHVCIMM